jgi:hypothetical protein
MEYSSQISFLIYMYPEIQGFVPEPTARKRRARVLIPPGYLHPGKRKH